MRPGQEVKLRLQIEALNEETAAADFLTFRPHDSYQATVNGQVNEAIRLLPTATPTSAQLVDVTIKCLHPCEATKLLVLDEQGTTVGQLNVVDNTKTYRLPIRVIYLVKQGPASSTDLMNLQTDFAALNLKKYLNENSLNQAQIQVDFENTNQQYELTFDEDTWATEGFFDKANNWFTNRAYTDEKQQAQTESILERFLTAYTERYEKKEDTPFRGILLFMTNLLKNKADNEGGVAFTYPEPSRQCIVFKSNLGDKSTYAHEIGHVLGLEHTFWETKEKASFIKAKQNITDNKNFIESSKKSISKNEEAIKHNKEVIKVYSDQENKWTLLRKDPRYTSSQKVEIDKTINDSRKNQEKQGK